MEFWPEKEKIRGLILLARSHSEGFKNESDEMVTTPLDKVSLLLDIPVDGSHQLKLIISAARQHVRRLEKNILDAMRLDRWVSMHDEAILVRLRIICAELIGLLTDAFDNLNPIPVRSPN